MAQTYVHGITGTVTHYVTSGLTAGQIEAAGPASAPQHWQSALGRGPRRYSFLTVLPSRRPLLRAGGEAAR